MKILLTGATGYIGKRLLPLLVNQGYEVICGVRDTSRFNPPESLKPSLKVIQLDLLDSSSLKNIPNDIEAAYYLVHSMSASTNYSELEKESAINFRNAINKTKAQQVIYLSGIINEENLSEHLSSRKTVEMELEKGSYELTTLRAGIIIGSGSASFEIIRDIVEKLPFMITPKWVNTLCQPIGISDVLVFLSKSLQNQKTYGQSFDIGGPDVLTYKEMLYGFAKVRGLKRYIYTVPVMTPRLSSYWLYFVTSISYNLAIALVNSMKVEVVCRDNKINSILDVKPICYEEALEKAFDKIENNMIVSSWKDSLVSGRFDFKISEFLNVPNFGCFKDERSRKISNKDKVIENIWSIGGNKGWYYANFLWKIRGYLDKLFGGVGLRRGRTNSKNLNAGDALDFWRVLYANKEEGRLLLFAEMKLPGEAWLEFKVNDGVIYQTATFRPKGLLGRLYWLSILPLHGLIFKGMINGITETNIQTQ